MSFTKLEPLDKKYQESSFARMGNRMTAYRKFIGTPSKITMMNTLQDCLHDIYQKRPADPLLALSMRLQKKIAGRNMQKTNSEAILTEVQRLKDENHRLRLLLGPEGMDMSESMERIQFTVQEKNAKIISLENSRDGLEAEIVALKQRLANMRNIVAEKDRLIGQYARSLNKLYGQDELEAVVKIQAVQRGALQRQAIVEQQKAADEESDSSDDSDDDHHFDGDFEHIDHHLSVDRRHNHGVKKRRHLVVRKRAVETSLNNSQSEDSTDLADLDREIDAMLSDDDNEVMEQLDSQLKEILENVDLDDAIEAATKIQALHRGNADRKALQDEDDEEGVEALNDYLNNLNEEEVEHAVLKIQALARGRFVRKQRRQSVAPIYIGPQGLDVEALQAYLEDEDDEKVSASAAKIQARYRGQRDRKRARHVKEDKAAVKIQKIFRAKSARTETKRRRRRLRPQKSMMAPTKEIENIVVGPDDE